MDSKLHTRLAIVTANELGLAFPPRNLPKKYRPDLSTFYLVIVVTDRQTDRQTYAGDSIIPRESFRGDKYFKIEADKQTNLQGARASQTRMINATGIDSEKHEAVVLTRSREALHPTP